MPFLWYLDKVCQFLRSSVLWRPPSRRGSLSSRLSGSYNLRALNMGHEGSLPYPLYANVFFWKGVLSDTYIYFLFFWVTRFVFFDVLSMFHIAPFRNLPVWISPWCHFCVISILFVSFWGLMEATFSSWILSSGLNCARELRVSSLKHQDCCSHHLQIWFVESNVVQQLDYHFLSFWIVSWGGPKLKTFAVTVERQRPKRYRRNFAKIVAIRSPPLSF